MDKTTRNTVIIGIILISISFFYQFIIRPIQRDNKLEDCIYGKGVSSDIDLEKYYDMCFKKYGR